MKTTVYPTRSGHFPPASFVNFQAAMAYVREISDAHMKGEIESKKPWGICTCPAESFWQHQKDVLTVDK